MIRPLHDQLVIKLDKVPEKTGIIVLAGDEERLRTGTIVRTGPGAWIPGKCIRSPMDIKVGDRVAFFRENFETQQGREVSRIVEDVEPGMVLVRARDLLYDCTDQTSGGTGHG